MATSTVGPMFNSWKKRPTFMAMILALAAIAAACAGSSESASTTAETPTTVEIQEAPTATPPQSDGETQDDAPEPSATPAIPATDDELDPPASPEPETADEFEAFGLPAYVTDMIGEDYESYLVEVESGISVHVLEVGSGYPVYLQHGAPTSGLLYRKVAELLPPDQFRVIMPTMVGLGFSTKVPADQHTLDNHVRWMNATLTQLDITELIYVGHDWGGPVGLGALARSPELMQGAVILNTLHITVEPPILG